MSNASLKTLVVGATGSVGRHVVREAVSRGHGVRALIRDTRKGRELGEGVELAIGDLTETDTLGMVVDGINAVVFTHGSHGSSLDSERIDYGGVRNVLAALGARNVRVALMTSIGVTNRAGSYNRSTEAHDWKLRSERLLRASGLPYTIVRPGWFDCNDDTQHRLVLLQGDRRQSGTPRDGVIARKQIAEVLVGSLTSVAALGKTFELVAEKGPAQDDLEPLFAALAIDKPGEMDAALNVVDMPFAQEPARVRADIETIRRRQPAIV